MDTAVEEAPGVDVPERELVTQMGAPRVVAAVAQYRAIPSQV